MFKPTFNSASAVLGIGSEVMKHVNVRSFISSIIYSYTRNLLEFDCELATKVTVINNIF